MKKETTTTKETKAPRYRAFHVAKATGEGQKDRWIEIGAFFEHADGAGGTLVLESLPIAFDGRVVLRAPKAEAAAAE